MKKIISGDNVGGGIEGLHIGGREVLDWLYNLTVSVYNTKFCDTLLLYLITIITVVIIRCKLFILIIFLYTNCMLYENKIIVIKKVNTFKSCLKKFAVSIVGVNHVYNK